MIKIVCVKLPDKLSVITNIFPFEQTSEVARRIWQPIPPYQKIIEQIFDGNDIERDWRLFPVSRM